MVTQEQIDSLIALRRELHQFPEVGWTEFRTTARIIKELRGCGIKVLTGKSVVDPAHCNGRIQAEVDQALAAVRAEGLDPALLEEMQGYTGCVAVIETGRPGPTVALRFDIDGLPILESKDPSHKPASQGFRSRYDGRMHACGHDCHASLGMTVTKWIAAHKDTLCGCVKVVFQPAEEGVRGAAAVAASGVLDDADWFFSSHIAMMAKSGEIVVDPYGFLCTTKLDLTITGKPAHAGAAPEAGCNALAAACSAVTQMLGISRHSGGMTRINVGTLTAGEGRNVIPSHAKAMLEVRGETGDINAYMESAVRRIVEGTCIAYGVTASLEKMGEACDLQANREAVDAVRRAATGALGVTKITERANFGGSEDATILCKRVQDHGGKAAFFVLGSDRPSGHHTFTFDIDEKSLATGLDIYTRLVTDLCGQH